jgi:hypothetical protein
MAMHATCRTEEPSRPSELTSSTPRKQRRRGNLQFHRTPVHAFQPPVEDG